MPNTIHLTPREKEILKLMMKGATNKEIANELIVSTNTIKFYVSSIIRKFNAKNRTNAVAKWLYNLFSFA